MPAQACGKNPEARGRGRRSHPGKQLPLLSKPSILSQQRFHRRRRRAVLRFHLFASTNYLCNHHAHEFRLLPTTPGRPRPSPFPNVCQAPPRVFLLPRRDCSFQVPLPINQKHSLRCFVDGLRSCTGEGLPGRGASVDESGKRLCDRFLATSSCSRPACPYSHDQPW